MTTFPMTVQDALWLTMDRPNNLMVVDGAMVLAGQPTLQQVRGVYAAALERFPVFGRKAVRHGHGWAWQDDEHFNLPDHITEVSLGESAEMRSLQNYMAEQRSVPLAMDRPRWRASLVTDLILPDGSEGSAVVSRFHHSIADGIRLTQVILGMCESDGTTVAAVVARGANRTGSGPTEKPGDQGGRMAAAGTALADATASVSHVTSAAVAEAETIASGSLDSIRHPRQAMSSAARDFLHVPDRLKEAARLGIGHGIEAIRHPDHLLDALEHFGVENNRTLNDAGSLAKLALGMTPETVWTGKPGRAKALAWSEPVPLADIKAVGKANDATVNDVLLAAVAGGLREYLERRDGLVDEISWMVPVNLKPFEENLPPELGNYFALVFLPMALHHDNAADRLAHMRHSMDRIKHSDEAVITFGLQRAMSVSPEKITFFLTNFFANKAVGVLTNVPGPTTELKFAGVPVRQTIGFAPCSGNDPMTATIFSYNGGVTVGFATDVGLIPDPEVLSELVIEELTSLIDTEMAHD